MWDGNTVGGVSDGSAVPAARKNIMGNVPALRATKTWDPGSVSAGASTSTTVTVTGATMVLAVQAWLDLDLQGLTMTAYVSAADTVAVVLANLTGSPVDLGSGTLTVQVGA
jgi:hypothetical protein